eukprot:15091021-Ditylum_brightwellii.AAC.1
MSVLEKQVSLLDDTPATMKGQWDSENMVAEVGSHIFKGGQDVRVWMEENLLQIFLFGVFVDMCILP